MKEKEVTELVGIVGRCKWQRNECRIRLLIGKVYENQNGSLYSDTKWYNLKVLNSQKQRSFLESLRNGDKIRAIGHFHRRYIKDNEGWTSIWEDLWVEKLEKLS